MQTSIHNDFLTSTPFEHKYTHCFGFNLLLLCRAYALFHILVPSHVYRHQATKVIKSSTKKAVHKVNYDETEKEEDELDKNDGEERLMSEALATNNADFFYS